MDETAPSSDLAALNPSGEPSGQSETPNQPKRVMGFRDLVLFYVVTGISLRWIATAASAGPSSIVIWLGAWLFFYTPLALSVIELSSRYPDEGGIYVWSKRAFGDFAGFITAWTYWACNLPYFPAVLYFAASNALYIRQGAWGHLSNNTTFYVVFSLVALILATLLNILGLNVGTWLHNVGAIAMWIPVAIVVGMGAVAWHRYGAATSFNTHTMMPSFHLKDIIFWSVLIYAFAGSETASLLGGEIKNARRAIPHALLIGGVTVTFCYIVGTMSVLVALPASEVGNLQGLMQAISKTAERIGLTGIVPLAALLITLSNVGAAGAYLAAGGRLPFVAGIDHFLPSAFGAVHPRWKTPWVGLLTQFVFGTVFVFLGQAGTSIKGAYDVLVSMGVITYFIPFLYLFGAMFKLQNEAAGADVIRVPGGKPVARFVAIVGLLTTTFTIGLALIPQADEPNKPLAVIKVVGLSGLLVLIGAWIYWAGKKRAVRAQMSDRHADTEVQR